MPNITPKLANCTVLYCTVHRTMFQCAVWNTWGPVEPVALVAFPSWTDSTIGLTHLFKGLMAQVTNLNFQPQRWLDLDIPYIGTISLRI